MDVTPKIVAVGPIGPHSKAAINAFTSCETGIVTLEDMNAAVGRECSAAGKGYGNVATAKRHMLKQHGQTWEWQSAEKHWKLLDGVEVIDHTKRLRRWSMRAARWRSKKLWAVDPEELDGAQKRSREVALLADDMIATCSGANFEKTAQKKLTTFKKPDLGRLIDMMQQNGNDTNQGHSSPP